MAYAANASKKRKKKFCYFVNIIFFVSSSLKVFNRESF